MRTLSTSRAVQMRNAFPPTRIFFDGLTFPALIHFSRVIGWMPTLRAISGVESGLMANYTSLFHRACQGGQTIFAFCLPLGFPGCRMARLAMSAKVCVLKKREVDAWLNQNQPPVCSRHYHVRKVEAFDMTGRGDSQFYDKKNAVADWIGLRQIQLRSCFEWKIVGRRSFPHLVLLEQGARPYHYRLCDLKPTAA